MANRARRLQSIGALLCGVVLLGGVLSAMVSGTGGEVSTTTSVSVAANAPVSPSPSVPGATPANFTVAFIADQGNNKNADAVLRLIKNKGAQLVIHSGDLDYDEDPIAFDNRVTTILGPEFPYLVSRGNHDIPAWNGYKTKLQSRIHRHNADSALPASNKITCTGPELGLKSSCTYQGLHVLLLDPPAFTDEDRYIRQELANSRSIWKVCSWHYNQEAMQVGEKEDEVGWEAYEECRKGGAFIATGHEHIYARTRTLSNTQTQTIDAAWPDANRLRVAPGSTFVFVSGLGGQSIDPQKRCRPAALPYGCKGEWAKIYTKKQDARFGALFITFHVDGDPKKARGEFFNIKDPQTPIDSFTITADVRTPQEAVHTDPGAVESD